MQQRSHRHRIDNGFLVGGVQLPRGRERLVQCVHQLLAAVVGGALIVELDRALPQQHAPLLNLLQHCLQLGLLLYRCRLDLLLQPGRLALEVQGDRVQREGGQVVVELG